MKKRTFPRALLMPLFAVLGLSSAGFAGTICQPGVAFRPLMGSCLQTKTGLKWWTEGAAVTMSHDSARAVCESQSMRLASADELISLMEDGALKAFHVNLDEIFWASESAEASGKFAALYLPSPQKLAIANDQVASVICVAKETAKKSSPLVQLPQMGMVLQRLEDMCWYDGAGARREKMCAHPEVKKGCALALGAQWRLPSADELRQISIETYLNGCVSSADGPACLSSHHEDAYDVHATSDTKTARYATYCITRAPEADSDGDNDGDGIPNKLDRCSRTPAISGPLVYKSGAYIGCAPGEMVDNPGVP